MSCELGKIIILNGPPRSGKSSIAKEIQKKFEGIWMNLGVDNSMAATPERFQPGIGLRPGGERPDLEPLIHKLYLAIYESIAAYSRQGINVVADFGHHHAYAAELTIFPECANILQSYPVMLVGVHCPIDIIMERRKKTWNTPYEKSDPIPQPVARWQQAVHAGMVYDMELDTSEHTPEECAELIHERMNNADAWTAIKQIAQK